MHRALLIFFFWVDSAEIQLVSSAACCSILLSGTALDKEEAGQIKHLKNSPDMLVALAVDTLAV